MLVLALHTEAEIFREITRRDHDTKGWRLYDFYVGGNSSMGWSAGHNMAALWPAFLQVISRK
jgi:hypothetical protein